MKSCLFGLLALCSVATAEIIETTNIDDVLSHVDESTLVLFDIDDTLIDSVITLNSGVWTEYYWQLAPQLVPDLALVERLMWFYAERIPVKAIEEHTPAIIEKLQACTTTLALTARSTEIYDLTARQLRSIGIDFSESEAPEAMQAHPSHVRGIIFTNEVNKGEHLCEVLAGYRPSKVVFVDDRRKQVESVDQAMQEAGIPTVCFWYKRARCDRASFDPMIGICQLHHLLHHDKLLDDEAATPLQGEPAELLLALIRHFEKCR